MPYNPFDKNITEIVEQDLAQLIDRQISEGWYIEYKKEIPTTSLGKLDSLKISKSVSSFANTKGGWIFWGITTDNRNNPISIDGISISEYKNIEDQISQTINSNISPNPIYHLKKIELINNNYLFIIQVEESPTPPYITSQGIIYQRENNESKPIKDRYIIEKLNEKTTSYYDSIERFCSLDFTETKGQADWNQTYLELYLFPLPFDSFSFSKFYSSDFFKEVAVRFYQSVEVNLQKGNEEFKQTTQIDLNLGFNSIYSSESSLIIRPLNEKNLIYKSTTVELFENGNLKFLIPLYEFNSENIPKHYLNSNIINYLLEKYSPYETVKQNSYLPYGGNSDFKLPDITRRSTTDFVNHIKFIDGTELIFTILIILSKYKAVLSDNNFDMKSKLGFRARITDCWRKFVFFDNDDYLEKIKLYNIPLSPKNEIEIPEFKNGKAYKVDLSDDYAYFQIARFILEGIGLPDSHSITFSDIITNALERIKKQNGS
ncbi:MAG: ATP-binding protein [Bacteroidetes bacterium]|nr:ATP-binding protein [Bacteroidota bacterium]